MLDDLAYKCISPLIRLVSKAKSPYQNQSRTLAKHCLKLIKYEYKDDDIKPIYIGFSEIEKAIGSAQHAVSAAANSPLSLDTREKEIDCLFKTARQLVNRVYGLMHPGVSSKAQAIRDKFTEDMDDAVRHDHTAANWKQAVAKAEAAKAAVRSELIEALQMAAVDVKLSVVDITTTNATPFLVRGKGTPQGKFHNTLRLNGLIFKLKFDGIIQEMHQPRFYLSHEKQQRVTKDGLVFKSLGASKMLKSAAENARREIELFLVLAPTEESFVVVTCGYERSKTDAPPDVGEVVRKPNNGPVPRSALCDGVPIFQNAKAKAPKGHEKLQWGDLAKGDWVVPLQENPQTKAILSNALAQAPRATTLIPNTATNQLTPDTEASSLRTSSHPQMMPVASPDIIPLEATSTRRSVTSAVSEKSSHAHSLSSETPTSSSASRIISADGSTLPTSASPSMTTPSREDLVKQAVPPSKAGSGGCTGPVSLSETSAQVPTSCNITPVQPEPSLMASSHALELQRSSTGASTMPSPARPIAFHTANTRTAGSLRPRGSLTSISSKRSASIKPIPVSQQPAPPSELPRPMSEIEEASAPAESTRAAEPTKPLEAMKSTEPEKKERAPVKAEVVDQSWGGWLKKKVVPRVVRYVFGVAEYE
ncbi:hypothetical protein FRB96_005133 [Tulasnella sp. 330]|nr:hypothetical protein FRB96_005133 [Tulasnella sp. 330]